MPARRRRLFHISLLIAVCVCVCVCRDGQLKREKLKPSFLAEQQAEYSRRIRVDTALDEQLAAADTRSQSVFS